MNIEFSRLEYVWIKIVQIPAYSTPPSVVGWDSDQHICIIWVQNLRTFILSNSDPIFY